MKVIEYINIVTYFQKNPSFGTTVGRHADVTYVPNL